MAFSITIINIVAARAFEHLSSKIENQFITVSTNIANMLTTGQLSNSDHIVLCDISNLEHRRMAVLSISIFLYEISLRYFSAFS